MSLSKFCSNSLLELLIEYVAPAFVLIIFVTALSTIYSKYSFDFNSDSFMLLIGVSIPPPIITPKFNEVTTPYSSFL